MRAQSHKFATLATLVFCFSHALLAWSPGTGSPNAVQGFSVDTTNRTDVLAFYNCVYNASQNYPTDMVWTGSITSGLAGTTSATFKNDVQRRINFYRALAGLPADITFDASECSNDQDAALMFSANSQLSHTPSASWAYYTSTGATAAGNSNIALGTYGPGSVDAYMVDDGSNNLAVGHRRWLVYSRAQTMGTGDVTGQGSYYPANAIWVIGNFKPAPAPQFVAWPGSGYFPFPLLPDRWSLSYPGANFATANVTMAQGVTNVPVTIISNTDNGYGDNTLVWMPSSLPSSINADTPYNVTVSGISGAGVPASYSYNVTLFDPNVLGNSVTISGSPTPYTTGATYTFNSIAQADSYQLQVATGSTAAWIEGAEDSPTPQILAATAASYSLRQTTVVHSGAKAFHLTIASFSDGNQSFEINRNIVPSATSTLFFYDLFRWVTTASRLSAEVSPDNGSTWTEVWGRNGNSNNSSSGWDTSFQTPNTPVSLASYAGMPVRVRFIFRPGNSAFLGADTDTGVFIDDITVTNATQLVNETTTSLAGNATSFTLNATTAGSSLVAGTSYYMRICPSVGTRWFGYGPQTIVTAQTPSGYALWAAQYPGVSGGPGADCNNDGLCNGLAYAFGLNPMSGSSPAAVPLPTRGLTSMTLSCTQPPGVTGVTYGAQCSTNLVNWSDVTDTGTASTHTFTVSTVNQPRMFMRWKITVTP